MATVYFNATLAGVPVVKAGSYGHGVEGHGQPHVANGQVDDKVLGRFEEVLLLVGDVEQRAVPNQRTHSCKSRSKAEGETDVGFTEQIQVRKASIVQIKNESHDLCPSRFLRIRDLPKLVQKNALTFCCVETKTHHLAEQ